MVVAPRARLRRSVCGQLYRTLSSCSLQLLLSYVVVFYLCKVLDSSYCRNPTTQPPNHLTPPKPHPQARLDCSIARKLESSKETRLLSPHQVHCSTALLLYCSTALLLYCSTAPLLHYSTTLLCSSELHQEASRRRLVPSPLLSCR